MLLQTLKGRILAVALGMTMFSVLLFGYGLLSIYHEHMHKCLNRSLSFLTSTLLIQYDPNHFSEATQKQMHEHPQVQNAIKGGLISDLRIEVFQEVPISKEERVYQYKMIDATHYFTLSSSTQKIDEEVANMVAQKWIFFFLGFAFTSFVIYFLVRLLFAPFNELVSHCLTCDDPDKKPDGVSGGVEIVAMRDAISTLQERISKLQKERHDAMKALTHELKTPLAQLRLRIDMANERGKWTPNAAQEAKEEIDEIAAKITQILHSKKTNTQLQEMFFQNSVEKILEDVESLWRHRGLSFEIKISQNDPIQLPLEAFERVVRILIENSINHSKKSSVIKIFAQGKRLQLTNTISQDPNKIIDSTGKGLEIAKTLCDYYGWELKLHKEALEYTITLTLP